MAHARALQNPALAWVWIPPSKSDYRQVNNTPFGLDYCHQFNDSACFDLFSLPALSSALPPQPKPNKQHVVSAAEPRVGLGPGDTVEVSPSRPRDFTAPAHWREELVERHSVRRHQPLKVVVDARGCAPGQALQHLRHGGTRVAGPNIKVAMMLLSTLMLMVVVVALTLVFGGGESAARV